MKKFITSALFIAIFATYSLYLRAVSPVIASTTGAQTTSAVTQTVSSTNNTNSSTNSGTNQTATVASTVPGDLPKGRYRDGIYTGSSADAFYGNIQVKITISGGKITDVAFLDYPQDRSTSREINATAMPQLRQEAIAAQSAQVDGVSGASDTSAAFVQSLASALTQAKA